MCEMPSAFTTKQRKALKAHICCECGNFINPGENYQYSSGIWDSEPRSFKQCGNCYEIMQAASKSAEYCEDSPCFQGLHEWFNDYQCKGFTGKEWLHSMASQINIEPEKLNKLLCV
jgi:hypothetical protein